MISYIMANEDWTWEEAFKQAGYGALSSIVGDKLARAFARKIGDATIKAKQIFSGGLENRKLAESLALGTSYKGFKNANLEIKNNNPVFDLFDNYNNVVDVTTTAAKNLRASSFYRKIDRLAGLDNSYGTRTLQIYVEKGRYSEVQLNQLKKKLVEYSMGWCKFQ